MKNNKSVFYKMFIMICICIIFSSLFSVFFVPVYGSTKIKIKDSTGKEHKISVIESSESISIPETVEQTSATYNEFKVVDWQENSKKIYDMWEAQNKPVTQNHWAYIKVNDKNRYLVYVSPIYGQVGDSIDISVKNDKSSKVYECIIAGIKDIWTNEDTVYKQEKKAYGSKVSDKCSVVEICSDLSSDTASSDENFNSLLAKMAGVTKIANGGNLLENSNEKSKNETSTNSGAVREDAEDVDGGIKMVFTDIWDSINTVFENSVRHENNTSVMYDAKDLGGNMNTDTQPDSSNATGITDSQIQAMYDEYLRNKGKRYLMSHSNYSPDKCMSYYDCSSWTIHCLAHSGVKRLGITNAAGIYNKYCYKVAVEDRKPGDIIFLQGTYKRGISHVGIYLGEFTVDGETAEWVIDTGGNPKGVKISKYKNGHWNGRHFYAFGRLKD